MQEQDCRAGRRRSCLCAASRDPLLSCSGSRDARNRRTPVHDGRAATGECPYRRSDLSAARYAAALAVAFRACAASVTVVGVESIRTTGMKEYYVEHGLLADLDLGWHLRIHERGAAIRVYDLARNPVC